MVIVKIEMWPCHFFDPTDSKTSIRIGHARHSFYQYVHTNTAKHVPFHDKRTIHKNGNKKTGFIEIISIQNYFLRVPDWCKIGPHYGISQSNEKRVLYDSYLQTYWDVLKFAMDSQQLIQQLAASCLRDAARFGFSQCIGLPG